MDGFQAAFDIWVRFLGRYGFAVEAHLNPPATEAEIAAAEAEIGFRLPDDLRALYLRADGQESLFGAPDPAPGTILTALFGQYDFVSLARAVQDYRTWEEVIDDWPEGADPDAFITLRAGDPPVAREYWRRGWFPFARDGGGNAYAVDLSPVAGGIYGQVILIGSDEDERRVLAPSLTAFLIEAATREPLWEPAEDDDVVRFFYMEP